jgi:ankyrin repeat protein
MVVALPILHFTHGTFFFSDVNLRDLFGKTPLHNAINGKHINIVDLLIKNGADVRSPDERGDTPLHEAVSTGNDKIVQV